ncbi:unnamed protein product [Sphagnum jensenii]|uniref:Citrate transporter-like domain-containing protein n=1 Tax=Sphagnum jensenii TaxID=128206 RepID=A0ABP0VE12_9BRYO
MYASSIGGQASLIGTSSNIFVKGYFETYHPTSGLNFLSFILYALPVSLVQLVAVWLILGGMFLPRQRFIFNFDKKDDSKNSTNTELKQLVRETYRKLGPFSWEQVSIGIFFSYRRHSLADPGFVFRAGLEFTVQKGLSNRHIDGHCGAFLCGHLAPGEYIRRQGVRATAVLESGREDVPVVGCALIGRQFGHGRRL